MHTPTPTPANWFHDPPIRPTTCTPDEFSTLVGIVHDPEPVRRFLRGFCVDLFSIAGGKGVARAG